MKIKNHHLFLSISISLLFLILMINYLDRTAIAFAITPIKIEFKLTNAEFGLLGSAFGFGYLFMTVVGGILVDKFKAHKVLTFSSALWSLGTILFALATSFGMLFFIRFVVGIMEGPCFQAVTGVIADWLSIENRVKNMAICLAAVPFASVVGAPLVSHLIIWFDWRKTYIILGVIGLGLSALWYVFYKDKDARKFVSAVEPTPVIDWHFLIFNRSLMASNIAYFAYGYLLFFALLWLPGYLEQTYAIELNKVGWFLTMPWLFGTVRLLVGGFLSDMILAKTGSIRVARSHMIWVSQLVSALCFIPVILIHSELVAITFISLGVGFGLMPNAIFYSLNIDIAKDKAATSLGVMDCFFGAAGIIAPWLTGVVSTVTHSFNSAILIMIVFTLLGVLSIFFFQNPEQKALL